MPGLDYTDSHYHLEYLVKYEFCSSVYVVVMGKWAEGILSQADRLFRADAVVSHGPTSPVLKRQRRSVIEYNYSVRSSPRI